MDGVAVTVGVTIFQIVENLSYIDREDNEKQEQNPNERRLTIISPAASCWRNFYSLCVTRSVDTLNWAR